MSIRNRLTLVFTLLTGLVLFGTFEAIYVLSNRHMQSEFFAQLRERTTIAEQYYLEEDELGATIYQEVRQKHLRQLPGEREIVVPAGYQPSPTDTTSLHELPSAFLEQIQLKGEAQYRQGDTYYHGQQYLDDEGVFLVIVSAQNAYGAGEIRNLRRVLLITFFLGMILVYLLGTIYSGRVLNPISQMTDRVTAITASNLHLRLDESSPKDELGKLADTFNDMLDRLETSFELQTHFINNASHELRNPLTAILSETEYRLQRDFPRQEYRESLATIAREAKRLDLLTSSLLSLAQTTADGDGWRIDPIRMDELLWEAQQVVDSKYPDNQVQYDFSNLPATFEHLQVDGNESLLKVAITNIIDNACKFSNNKKVFVRLTGTEKAVEILVEDSGIGIPEEDINHIFEPLYRAANARDQQGFGVGLSLAQKILQVHKGQLDITSGPGRGTTVRILIPTRIDRTDGKYEFTP